MPRGDWPYTLIVPALVLTDLPGERQSARIDFPDIDLGGGFCIEFWFRTDAYPTGAASAVLMAGLKTGDNSARDLILRLDGQHITPEFQDFHGPLADPPPLNRWTHVTLSYWTMPAPVVQEGQPPITREGQLQVNYWQDDQAFIERSVQLAGESYRLSSLVLAAENGATHLFSELRLWQPCPSPGFRLEYRGRSIEGAATGLIGYWRLDEGSGNLMVDSSLGANDGVIEGGKYQTDSGLALRIGTVFEPGSGRGMTPNGKCFPLGSERAMWRDPPRCQMEQTHLNDVEKARRHLLSSLSDRSGADALFHDATEELRTMEAKRDAESAALEDIKNEKAEAIQNRRTKIRDEELAMLKSIETSQKIHLKDFIVRLQADLSHGRERIGREYGRVYGLDNVAMDVKVVPGVGGIGLHLPEPGMRIDPERLSTLKLRFKAVPTEEVEGPKSARVPALEGSTEDFARRKLGQAGFRVEVVYQEVADPAQQGRVLAQIFEATDKPDQAVLASIVTLVVGQRQ
jgi:hypothetical protein